MKNRRALIICNGDPPSRRFLKALASEADSIVAADGGANTARRLGIRPSAIIGDLDSITPATRRYFASSLILRVKRQDNTDIEKALDFVLAQGIRDITLTGISGGRIDFTFGNLAILWRYARRANLQIASDGWRAFPVTSGFSGRATRGATVSFVPFGPCHGVTLHGLKYPLRHATIPVGGLGLSNVAVRSRVSVRIRRGRLMVFILDRRAARGNSR